MINGCQPNETMIEPPKKGIPYKSSESSKIMLRMINASLVLCFTFNHHHSFTII